jgi:hypothetical protein
MLSAAWLALKFGLGSIAKFCSAHWRIILPLAILGYCLHLYFVQVNRADAEKVRADNSIAALQAFKTAITAEAIKRQSELLSKKLLAQKNDAIADAIAKADLARLNLNRIREMQNLKDQYEASNNSTKLNFTERLRLDAERYRLGLSESLSNTSGPTESERECNAAYITLEAGCQITTVDFNRCRAWADNVCLTVGCE